MLPWALVPSFRLSLQDFRQLSALDERQYYSNLFVAQPPLQSRLIRRGMPQGLSW
jgi:hypothetical protein